MERGTKGKGYLCLDDIRVSKGPLRAARGARLDSRCDPWQDRCLYGLAKGADKVGQAGPRLFDRVSRTPHLHHKKISPIPIGSYGCSRWVFRCKGIKAYASRLRMRGDIDLFLCGPTSLFPWSTGPILMPRSLIRHLADICTNLSTTKNPPGFTQGRTIRCRATVLSAIRCEYGSGIPWGTMGIWAVVSPVRGNKKSPPGFPGGRIKKGTDLLSHLLRQYHRLWRA